MGVSNFHYAGGGIVAPCGCGIWEKGGSLDNIPRALHIEKTHSALICDN
jgi:hypothetical protein